MGDWWASLSGVERIFVAFALPFSLLTLVEFILELTGIGSHHNVDDSTMADLALDDSGGFLDHFTFFSVRNLIYFLMMFGWTGLAFSKLGVPSFICVILGIIAGLITTVIIGWVFYMLSKLTETGTTRLANAVGKIGTVYLAVPGDRKGSGVIQLVLQGATQEMNAVTNGAALPTGKSVQVVDIIGGNTALVIGSDDV